MVANLTAVALYIIATAVAWDENATAGGNLTLVVILHAFGAGILGLSGWLGGEMVYRHHLAVVPDDREAEVAERARHGAPAAPRGQQQPR
jgi:uncharacterized membrane protein